MMSQPRHRLSITEPLMTGGVVTLTGNPAHYVANVLRLRAGDAVALFNRTQGEWRAVIAEVKKREVVLRVETCLRTAAAPLPFTVCFAPIKGGRLETIIEKATELGAAVLQPVITQRTIVGKVNLERANAIAREAAEQCERMDWPEIREPVKLEKLLADWPAGVPLVYGDETGGGGSITELLYKSARPHPESSDTIPGEGINDWGILVGPEGGFAPQELALLARHPASKAVGLGPRILRADTALITLATATLIAWGDWHQPPRFNHDA